MQTMQTYSGLLQNLLSKQGQQDLLELRMTAGKEKSQL